MASMEYLAAYECECVLCMRRSVGGFEEKSIGIRSGYIKYIACIVYSKSDARRLHIRHVSEKCDETKTV